MNPKCEPYQVKMEKSIEVMKQDFNTIRAGRANAAVLDKITVDYYGTATPIQQIASISTPEPRMLSIQPWDASALKLIEKAILASDLGINPTNDGKVIRLLFPQLTEERRRDLIKSVKKMTEDTKVAIRKERAAQGAALFPRSAYAVSKKEQTARTGSGAAAPAHCRGYGRQRPLGPEAGLASHGRPFRRQRDLSKGRGIPFRSGH